MNIHPAVTSSKPASNQPTNTGATSTNVVFDWGNKRVVYASKACGQSNSPKPLFGFLRLSSLVGGLAVLGVVALVLYLLYGYP